MIGKIIGIVILGTLTAICFYSASISHLSNDSQGYWLFLAFGMLFLIPLFLVLINLAGQRAQVFKRFYDKLAGTDRPQSGRFVPHWFMMTAGAILLICLLSFIIKTALPALLSHRHLR